MEPRLYSARHWLHSEENFSRVNVTARSQDISDDLNTSVFAKSRNRLTFRFPLPHHPPRHLAPPPGYLQSGITYHLTVHGSRLRRKYDICILESWPYPFGTAAECERVASEQLPGHKSAIVVYTPWRFRDRTLGKQ